MHSLFYICRSIFLCKHALICTCKHIYIHAYMRYAFIHTQTHTYILAYTNRYAYMLKYINAHTHDQMYIYGHTHMQAMIHNHKYIYMHEHISMCAPTYVFTINKCTYYHDRRMGIYIHACRYACIYIPSYMQSTYSENIYLFSLLASIHCE